MQIQANGIALEIEDHGPPGGEPLLLVMGLGMQLLAWHEDFVALLVQRGFRVIRYDNRDIGLSQGFDEFGTPNLALETLRHLLGLRVRSPYALRDMAADAAGILDALGIGSAHVCGASMGGMIGQHLAFEWPARVKSLTLMMTSSGARRLPGPSMKVRSALLSRPADTSLDGLVQHYVHLYRLIGSPGYPPDEGWLRRRLRTTLQRAYHPAGTARQMIAIAADGDRSSRLAAIRAPVQVLHGRDDPLVPLPAGRDLAAKIPGAALDVIDGMGHDLPMALWPRFVAGIASAADRARG
jgi:pimeloyl-ACP methyl ester carboxylesterase